MPMFPEAPGLFSTTTGSPHLSESFAPTMRGRRSATPPAGNGTMMCTGRAGYFSCAAAQSETPRAKAARPRRSTDRFMEILLVLSGWIDHGTVEVLAPGARDGGLVSRVGMAHHAARRVVAEDASQAGVRGRRPVAHDHDAGMLRESHADAAAVVDGDPRRPARGVEEGVEERPIGDGVAPVAHRLRLAVRARDGARVEVVAPDDDRRRELAPRDHLVERLADARAVAHADPADARGQSLERDAPARHVEPVVEVR